MTRTERQKRCSKFASGSTKNCSPKVHGLAIQFLIRHVIYEGDQSPDKLLFRVILFKLFNKIETWQLLTEKLGPVRSTDYSFARYDQVLSRAIASGRRIYSAAYIMPSGNGTFGTPRKHQAHLKLLERMMEDELAYRIADARTMFAAFKLLRSYPMIGDFLAYQYVIDSIVVICHARTPMLPWGQAQNFDTDKGVCDGIADCGACSGG